MKIVPGKLRTSICTLTWLAFLLSTIWVVTLVRQSWLDESLVSAMKKRETARAISLLNQGANANITEQQSSRASYLTWSGFISRFTKGRQPVEPTLKTEPLPKYYESGAYELLDFYESVPENFELITALLKHGAHIEAPDKYRRTALCYAAISDHEATVRLLLKRRANCNTSGSDGRTPLFYVIDNYIPLLIENGANVNARDQYGATPLMVAVTDEDSQRARDLLDHGAKIDGYDQEHRTAANWATSAESINCLDMLFQRGADMHCRDIDGRTLITVAVNDYINGIISTQQGVSSKDCTKTIRWLLAHGADVRQKDKTGHNALDYAISKGDQKVIDLLKSAANHSQNRH